MSRLLLTSDFKDVVQSGHVDWFWLAEMQLASGVLRLSALGYDIEWDGHTWTGVRGLGGIGPVEEAPTQVSGLRFSLAGVTESHIAGLLAESIQGRPVILRIVVLNRATEPPTMAVDNNVWQGLLDVQRYNESDAVISVTAENRLIEWDRPNLIRFSDEDQVRLHPGDRFFKLAAQMAERDIVIFSKALLASRL